MISNRKTSELATTCHPSRSLLQPAGLSLMLLLAAVTAEAQQTTGNWLPVPRGPFNLTMRRYSPQSEALTGSGIRLRLRK